MKNEKTFIVLVEDNKDKASNVIASLEKEGVEYYQLSAINPALKFITEEHERIDGIILDLGLPRFEKEMPIDPYAGLKILDELKRLKLNIPVLINSTTPIMIDVIIDEKFTFVFKKQMVFASDIQIIREFIKSL